MSYKLGSVKQFYLQNWGYAKSSLSSAGNICDGILIGRCQLVILLTFLLPISCLGSFGTPEGIFDKVNDIRIMGRIIYTTSPGAMSVAMLWGQEWPQDSWLGQNWPKDLFYFYDRGPRMKTIFHWKRFRNPLGTRPKEKFSYPPTFFSRAPGHKQ